MQQTSEVYRDLFARWQAGEPGVHYETRLAIGNAGTLITKQGESITFGGTSILVGAAGADSGYDENLLVSVNTDLCVFSGGVPSVGGCVSGQLHVKMLKPYAEIPKMARLVPYIRLTDGETNSEWLQKGVYYIDTRPKEEDGSSIEYITLDGFDDMLKAEQDYPSSTLSWPARDIDVVREIASFMGVSVDARTVQQMTWGYRVQYPGGYSCREVLGYIAAMYAGCFIMSDLGELRLVGLTDIPEETRYLIDSDGAAITFGGVRILV